MKLTTRVSLFFLATLAVVLTIYSLVFYSAGRQHVEYQFIGELQGVLNSLVAAAEVEETEVKWQPLEHSVALGASNEYGAVHWIVIGDRQLVVEHSADANDSFTKRALSFAQESLPTGSVYSHYESQQQLQYFCQRLIAPHPGAIEHELDEFDEILFVVGRSTVPRDAILYRLALLVTILPLMAWSLSALLGRWIVRRALFPVSQMAAQAQVIGGNDFRTRLSISDSGDELSELGAAFNRLLDRQQIAMGQQQRFAGDAAHELRTPLTVLLGQIDVSLRRPRSESEYLETMKKLRSQTASLQEIIESLLFLARSAGDAIAPPTEAIALRTWLAEHRESWRPWARSDDLQLHNHLEHDVKVLATPSLLSRVLDNLVSNGCKYSEPRTPVVITAEVKGGEAVITVCDSGTGIAPEDIPHLFEPFFRSANARRTGQAGTGLGLAIAHRIVTTIGGTLECESKLGQGSRFVLRLPVLE